MAKPGIKKLTAREERYAEEFLVCRNKTVAARRAGFSDRSSAQIGWEIHNKPHVKAYIRKRTEEVLKRLDIQQEDIIRGLLHVADLDPADMFDTNGNMLAIRDLPPEVRRAIAGFDITKTTVRNEETGEEETTQIARIRFNDRMKGLEGLGRTIAMFTDNQAIGGMVGGHPMTINFIPVGRDRDK
jgi:phage terminase small subunit